MTKLLTTSVIRGSHEGDSHGGAYLVDFDRREVEYVVDWRVPQLDWRGYGADRGLRGIAFDGETIYIAASNELLAFTPHFRQIGSWSNRYLNHCHEISTAGRTLFLTSTGYDSILGFDLDSHRFVEGMHVRRQVSTFVASAFDPHSGDGPARENHLHLNTVLAAGGSLYVSGMHTGGVVCLQGGHASCWAELPAGTHNAQPFADGVIFNDTAAEVLRYSGFDGGSMDRALRVPSYPPGKLLHTDLDDGRIARQGFARGLCILSSNIVAGGSSPSTLSLYDLQQGKRLASMNLTMDIRSAVHAIAAWPY